MSRMRRSEVLLIAGTVTAISAVAIAQITMHWSADNHAGVLPTGVALADFNLDGKVDIATLVRSPDRVQFLTHAKGPFFFEGPSLLLPAKSTPLDIAAADFNNNGLPDLAVTVRHPDGAVRFYNHTGKGSSYFEGQIVTLGGRPYGLSVGDYNSNGWLDVAVVNGELNTASVLTNKAGVFVGPVTFSTIGEPRDSSFGDISNNGFLELAVSDYGNRMIRTFQPSNWTPGVELSLGETLRPEGVLLADLTNNGWADVAAAASSPTLPTIQVVHVRYNLEGEFSAPAMYWTGGTGPSRLIAADLDCNGLLDLIVTNSETNDVAIIRNPTAPGSGALQVVSTGIHPGAVGAADLNGNGALDIVVANRDSDDVTVAINQSEGCLPVPCGFADLNCNGMVDVFDLLELLAAWGPCANPSDCPADLDDNGVVDVFDLLLLLANWG